MKDYPDPDYPSHLQFIMKYLDMKQEVLAGEIGVSQTAVSRWMKEIPRKNSRVVSESDGDLWHEPRVHS